LAVQKASLWAAQLAVQKASLWVVQTVEKLAVEKVGCLV
jgi:hypothetical protein